MVDENSTNIYALRTIVYLGKTERICCKRLRRRMRSTVKDIIPEFCGHPLSVSRIEMEGAEEVANVHTLSEELHPSAQGIVTYEAADQPDFAV
jgi:hypothetical protein